LPLIGLSILAAACTPATQDGGGSSALFYVILLVGIVAYFYFLIYRPRKRQSDTRKKAVESQQRGDDVITVGGIYGRIELIEQDTVILKLESGATMRIARMAIAGKVSDIAPQLQSRK
jgi:preprotein translocase subunit YajC